MSSKVRLSRAMVKGHLKKLLSDPFGMGKVLERSHEKSNRSELRLDQLLCLFGQLQGCYDRKYGSMKKSKKFIFLNWFVTISFFMAVIKDIYLVFNDDKRVAQRLGDYCWFLGKGRKDLMLFCAICELNDVLVNCVFIYANHHPEMLKWLSIYEPSKMEHLHTESNSFKFHKMTNRSTFLFGQIFSLSLIFGTWMFTFYGIFDVMDWEDATTLQKVTHSFWFLFYFYWCIYIIPNTVTPTLLLFHVSYYIRLKLTKLRKDVENFTDNRLSTDYISDDLTNNDITEFGAKRFNGRVVRKYMNDMIKSFKEIKELNRFFSLTSSIVLTSGCVMIVFIIYILLFRDIPLVIMFVYVWYMFGVFFNMFSSEYLLGASVAQQVSDPLYNYILIR